jgi:hypothetical protein
MSSDPLSITIAALADPTRRAILARLIACDVSLGKLAELCAQPRFEVLRAVSLAKESRHADRRWRRVS